MTEEDNQKAEAEVSLFQCIAGGIFINAFLCFIGLITLNKMFTGIVFVGIAAHIIFSVIIIVKRSKELTKWDGNLISAGGLLTVIISFIISILIIKLLQ
ncbi:MAG: hypothetical protein ACYTFY_15025 [Planctomycetota bacterium]|jgi:hypothetical protein